MKKVFMLFIAAGALSIAACGGKDKEEEAQGSSNEWSKQMEEYGLSEADITKAVEVGTKMQACYTCESAPRAMDSKMDCPDELMNEYEQYCKDTFGTDDYHAKTPEGKKVQGFREVMFDVRNKKCK